MTAHNDRIARRGVVAAAVAVTAALLVPMATAAPAAPAGEARPVAVVRELERGAHPLRTTEPGGRATDLRALGEMIGDATVVGLGEATQGSHESFAMKERVFRHLVEEKGFTVFALGTSWSAGLRIDEFLQGGPGDARQVVAEALAGSPWEREEFVGLIAWMREYNLRHPGRTVHFTGGDLGLPGLDDTMFERVLAHVRGTDPEALPRLEALYAELRPSADVSARPDRTVAQRRRDAATAQAALDLVTGTENTGDEEREWALQHARNIAHTFAYTAFDRGDPASLAAAELLRDRATAENTAWWQRRTGGKVLLSAPNERVGRLSGRPATRPTTQGALLRRSLGTGYVSIGVTFDRGSFLAEDTAPGGGWKRTTVPAAAAGTNEHTLDLVRHRDYYVDLRDTPSAARAWLDTARPVHDAGPVPDGGPPPALALGRAYDVLVHLHQVHEAERL
ncbi:erythromycin esterase family protein [Kitasatospora sp. NPDC004240]